jgi:hypothetical protein
MYWRIKSDDPSKNCNCDAIKDPVLKNGCKNFLALGWDNPKVEYEQVTCPPELVAAPPCNGGNSPANAPPTCKDPFASSKSLLQLFYVDYYDVTPITLIV